MKYRIVQEWDRDSLTASVQRFIDAGWIPQGGVATVGDAVGNRVYVQALVKS